MNSILLKNDPHGEGLCIYDGNGKPIVFHKMGDDLVSLLQKLGRKLGFEVTYLGTATRAEYEKDFC
jgi:hypothetical protein